MFPADPVLIVLIIFGMWISIRDLKSGKIKNTSIILLMASAIFINIFLTQSFLLYPIESAINITMAFFMAILLWKLGMWPAGDAKLFMSLAMLMPVTYYRSQGIFPSSEILIYALMPAFFLLAAIILFKTIRERKIEFIKKIIGVKMVVNFSVVFFAFFFIGRILLQYARISIDLFSSAVLFFALASAIKKIPKHGNAVYLIIGTASALLLAATGAVNLEMASNFAKYYFIFLAIMIIVDILGKNFFASEVKLKDLKEGAIPMERIKFENGTIEKISVSYSGLFGLESSKRGKNLIPETGSFTKTEIEKLRILKNNGKLDFDSVKIAKSIPFSPLLFIGALISYMLYAMH